MKRKLAIYGLSPNNGGIESFIYSISVNLVQEFEVIFIVFGDREPCYSKELVKLGCRIVYLPERKNSVKKNKKFLDEFFKKEAVDILHYNVSSLSYIRPCKIAKKYGCKVIVHAHNSAKSGSQISYILHTINKRYMRNFECKRIAVSKEAAVWAFGTTKNVFILDNGVNITRFKFDEKKREYVRKQLNVSDNQTLLIHVGAFKYQKNHEFLIKIYKEYYEHYNRDSLLILVGTGPLIDKIKDLVRDTGLTENIMFLGARSDIDFLLCGADVFVFPSITEGFPISLIEAEAAGLRCITSDVITGEAVLKEYCSKISLESSVEVWCNEINRISNPRRENATNHIRANGLDIDSMIDHLKRIYVY